MRSEAEAQRVVGIRRAVHIKDVRVREDVLVPISRLVQGNDALACPDQLYLVNPESAYRSLMQSGFNGAGAMVVEMVKLTAHLSPDLDVLLGDSLHRHGGAGVVSAQLLNERLGKRRVGFEFFKLLRVAGELDNALAVDC